MKKSIFLFFAAILCAMTANAQWALMGTLTDWGSGKAMTVSGTTATCDVDLTANTTYTLKVKNGSTWYGLNNTTIKATTTTSAFSTSGGDVTLESTFNGTYTFSFDTDSKKLTVTYPTEDKPIETHDITVKAKYPAGWNAGKAAIHFWGNGVASPGTPAAMTKDGDWWTYTVTGVPTTSPLSVIFINGDNWNGDKNQTVDITGITENICFEVSQSGNAKGLAAEADCETGEAEVIETHDITVKAFYPASWNAGKAAIHFWGTGVASPGTPAAMTKDGDWWTYTVTGVPTTTELSVIFINGNTWNGDANQTVDITGITESTCYQITSGSGKASAAVVDCESTPPTPEPEPTELTYNVTVPAGTKACYIAGDMNTWSFTEMTKVDDTHYTITIEGAKKSDGYKYASGGEWNYVEKDASGNEIGNRTWAENDVVASWASVYDPDAVEQELTYSVTVPEGTYACYIAMDTDPAQDGWEFNEMTKVDETHYTFVRTGLKNKTYKYTSGAGWEYVEKTAEDGEVADRQWAENDVVAKWNSVYNPTAPTYDYYLTGSLVGGWDVKQQGIEKDGELYKATFNALAAGTYEFKITAGDWEHQWNYNNLGAAYEEVSQGVDGEGNPNGNIKIVTEEAKNITVIFDATANKITFEGLSEVEPETLVYYVEVPEGTEDCYIAGAMNDWDFERMTQVDATHWTITYDNVFKTTEYKYAWQASWDYKELDQEGNDVANRTWTANDVVEKWNKPYTEVRTELTVGQWGTLCPKQNVANPTGATFYQISYLEEKCGMPFNMHFDQITETTLTAGQPYFFIASETEIKGVKWGEPKTEGSKVNGFYGYIGETSWTLPYQASFDATSDKNTFVIWNNSVFRINAETSIKSERCYININSLEPSRMPAPAPVGARRITMGVSGVNGQNTATGVDQVQGDNVPTKMIINGQLFILRGEKMYDAQGKLVK